MVGVREVFSKWARIVLMTAAAGFTGFDVDVEDLFQACAEAHGDVTRGKGLCAWSLSRLPPRAAHASGGSRRPHRENGVRFTRGLGRGPAHL